MKYAEFLERERFDEHELVALGHGTLVEDPPEDFFRIPLPTFLLLSRVIRIERGRPGRIVAEQDVRFDHWLFQCHFLGDPIQPGCMTLDTLWLCVAIHAAACGAVGSVRALGCKELELSTEIRPHNKLVTYEVEIQRVMHRKERGQHLAVADGRVVVDGEEACTVKGARLGLFRGIGYGDYPRRAGDS